MSDETLVKIVAIAAIACMVVLAISATIGSHKLDTMRDMVKAGANPNDASCAVYGDDKSCEVSRARAARSTAGKGE